MGESIAYEFDYLYCDTLITHVKVYVGGKIEFENFTDDVILRAFGVRDSVDMDDLYEFYEYRCVPKSRANINQLLKDAGFEYYDPEDWVRLNHGVMCDDCFWVRFAGEDLRWSDVDPLSHRAKVRVVDV